jgi:hypothetical protein
VRDGGGGWCQRLARADKGREGERDLVGKGEGREGGRKRQHHEEEGRRAGREERVVRDFIASNGQNHHAVPNYLHTTVVSNGGQGAGNDVAPASYPKTPSAIHVRCICCISEAESSPLLLKHSNTPPSKHPLSHDYNATLIFCETPMTISTYTRARAHTHRRTYTCTHTHDIQQPLNKH